MIITWMIYLICHQTMEIIGVKLTLSSHLLQKITHGTIEDFIATVETISRVIGSKQRLHLKHDNQRRQTLTHCDASLTSLRFFISLMSYNYYLVLSDNCVDSVHTLLSPDTVPIRTIITEEDLVTVLLLV